MKIRNPYLGTALAVAVLLACTPAFSKNMVIDDSLLPHLQSGESVSVIVILSDQFMPEILEEVRELYWSQLRTNEEAIREINTKYTDDRRPGDADEARSMATEQQNAFTAVDRARIRELNEQSQAIHWDIRRESIDRARALTAGGQQAVEQLIESLDGSVTQSYSVWNALSAILPGSSIEALASSPLVLRVFEEGEYETHIDVSVRSIGTPSFWQGGLTGGVWSNGLCDTGVDALHPALSGRTWYGKHFYAGGMNDDTGDRSTHGTHVTGIMNSTNPTYTGVSHGTSTSTNLKCASFTWPIVMAALDWGAYNTPMSVLNCSFGGGIGTDDDDIVRFFDAFIDHTGILTTNSAGNSGPSERTLGAPAVNWNGICVAMVDTKRTLDRSDDTIASMSSRGPTHGLRKKPDIAAPGASIMSANAVWETQPHFIAYSGTSMAAPHVGGAATLLYEAGIHDSRAVKAVLINTADFMEGNTTWSSDWGWGYLNLDKAYLARADWFLHTLTPTNPNRLYKVADPQVGDKVTMSWNRRVVYKGAQPPDTWSQLSNLDLHLYDEDYNLQRDSSTSSIDNVEQVISDTDNPLVIRARAVWLSRVEAFGLAVPPGTVSASGPVLSLQGEQTVYTPALDTDFRIRVRLANTGDLHAHNCTVSLTLPSGMTLVSGSLIHSLGTVRNGRSSEWTELWVRASTSGSKTIGISATSNSYGISSWSGSGSIGINPVTGETGSASGYVLSSAGDPIPGAVVSASPGGYKIHTAADGSYTILQMIPGTYTLTASQEGYITQTQHDRPVVAGGTTSVDFALDLAADTILGYVRDIVGNPIVGAAVWTNTGSYHTETGTTGFYNLSVSPGTYDVIAGKFGHDVQAHEDITVLAGESVHLDFTLLPATRGSISGFVRDQSNNPISGAGVYTHAGGHFTLTYPDGSYTIFDVPQGLYNVTAVKDAYTWQTEELVQVHGAQTAHVDFTISLSNVNLLRNGSFEEGFTQGVGNYWARFSSYSTAHSAGTDRVRDGYYSQKIHMPQPWNQGFAGVYQQAVTLPGHNYSVTAWNNAQMPNESYSGEHLVCSIGYDTTGGTRYNSSDVNWSEFNSTKNMWHNRSVTFTAAGDKTTAYLRAWRKWGSGGSDSYAWFDVARLLGPANSPKPPVVTDAGAYQASTTGIYASWNAFDKDHGINEYRYAISSNIAQSGIIQGGAWQSAGTNTSATRTGLNLIPGNKYYVLAQARNGVGLWSPVGVSDGIVILTGTDTIAEAKKLSDGSYITLSGVVCSRRPGSDLMFVQDVDRTAGIRVTAGSGSIPTIVSGTVCTVQGRLTTVANVRELTDVSVTVGNSGPEPAPLGLAARSVGGSDFFYTPGPPASGQIGSVWSSGPNNVGLLVTVWGRVLDTPSDGVFHVYDGSLPSGLPVRFLDGVNPPSQGSYAKVTGIAEPDGILLVSSADVVVY